MSRRRSRRRKEQRAARALVWRERFALSACTLLLGLASVRKAPVYGVVLIIVGTAGAVISGLFLSLAGEDEEDGLYERDVPFTKPSEIDDAFRDN